jgi:hypothetical protein
MGRREPFAASPSSLPLPEVRLRQQEGGEEEKHMRKALALLAGVAMTATPALARTGTIHVSGQGTIEDGRTFVVNARIEEDGTVNGKAILVNRNFSGEKGKGPYTLHVDISCAKQLDENTIIIGGSTARTNDPNLVDAVFFSVQDNGSDGDQVSRAYFWDDDPATVGDPDSCQLSTLADVPLEPVERGNINVH